MIDFENRLKKRFRHLAKWAKREGIEAFRVYDRDIPEHPYVVDLYGQSAVVYKFRRNDEETPGDLEESLNPVISRALGIQECDVYVKIRERQKGKAQYEKINEKRSEAIVSEGVLKFIVNFSDYLDTGLFLDHRLTRRWVLEEAKGYLVLNLFSYTCSLSVAALAGGAKSVKSVDMSNTYLSWGERNAKLNGQSSRKHDFVKADVLRFLKEELASSNRYGLVIFDPPSFSNSKGMVETLDIQRDHVSLLKAALRLVEPGGKLFFSTNRHGFKFDTEALPSWNIKDLTQATTPTDFERRPPHQAYCLQKP